jgi:hypothetical protein
MDSSSRKERMTPKSLYEAHRTAVMRYTDELPLPWEQLTWREKAQWELTASEQYRRDNPGEKGSYAKA